MSVDKLSIGENLSKLKAEMCIVKAELIAAFLYQVASGLRIPYICVTCPKCGFVHLSRILKKFKCSKCDFVW